MKKTINLSFLIIGMLLFSSCSKEEIPMTSTVDLAGEWMVTIDIIDGEEIIEDGFGFGQILWITYNTNSDDGKEIWLDNLGNYSTYFWNTKVKLPCNLNDLTFGSPNPVANQTKNVCDITVTGGKVTYGGAVTPSGMPADKIECYLTYSIDKKPWIYYIHGYRKTGFVEDDI